MKTEYTIIWVDDEIDTVEVDMKDIAEFLEEKGIQSNIQPFQATEDANIHDQIKSALNNPELDLIVVDFKMDGMNGRQLIDAIRDTDHVFLPVVFYSSAGVDALHAEAMEAKLDGVYFSSRDRVANKIREVVTSLLVKEQTSKRTRGLLMEGVSEIDANFRTLFLAMWGGLDEEKTSELMKYVGEKVSERKEAAQKLSSDLPATAAEFREFMADRFLSGGFDTITRWKFLKKLFELLERKDEAYEIFCRLFVKTTDDTPLIQLRNNYGHKTRAELEKSHNEGICIGIRREMRTQLKNMNDLMPDD